MGMFVLDTQVVGDHPEHGVPGTVIGLAAQFQHLANARPQSLLAAFQSLEYLDSTGKPTSVLPELGYQRRRAVALNTQPLALSTLIDKLLASYRQARLQA